MKPSRTTRLLEHEKLATQWTEHFYFRRHGDKHQDENMRDNEAANMATQPVGGKQSSRAVVLAKPEDANRVAGDLFRREEKRFLQS